jgi:hypothetical protein
LNDSSKEPRIAPISFGERVGGEPYNASEVVSLGDSRFLFCDNNVSDALFELHLTPEGRMASPLTRHSIRGIDPRAADDLEGMTLVEDEGRRFLIVTPSLSLKQRKKLRKKISKRGKAAPSRGVLLRISVDEREQFNAEAMAGFRSWITDNAPELGKSPGLLPDDRGLNVEGLGWDPDQQALLFGLRTPVVNKKPLILRVRLKQISGPWETGNLEMLPSIRLEIEETKDEQGIRAMGYDPSRGAWLVVIGNSTSSSKARFGLYSWDGNAQGVVRRFKGVRFSRRMRVEGVTYGTIGGRGAIVFVDDLGGYQVLWSDESRLH